MADRIKPLALLSLDGGGIRGMSELIILDEIMHRVQRRGNLESVPLPADYFDMICGTSTGGLIAILLGRLRLSVPAAIDKYRTLAKDVFSDKKHRLQDGIFKASNLEKATKDVVEGTLGNGRANERMFEEESGEFKPCKTFVCAMPPVHVSDKPRLFRTWKADRNPGLDAYIWEAGRATSAAPPFFKRIKIGPPGLEEEFVDGAIGCNNPVLSLVEETRREFDPNRQVGCIVSIGTGKCAESLWIQKAKYAQRILPASIDLIEAFVKLATSSERAASIMESRYQNCPGIYHRLNVDRGLETVSLEEWERLPEVKTHTMSYLEGGDISRKIDNIVDSLLGNPAQTIPLHQLDGTIQLIPQVPDLFIVPSLRVSHFVERREPLEDIERHLNPEGKGSAPSIFVLQGMGGCGKSQLALEFCHRAKENHGHSAIFWIDATSPASTSQSFSSVAKEMSKDAFDPVDNEANLQFVRSKLSSWPQAWLLVFDNFDDPKSFIDKTIKDYFPQSGSGSILVTSRHADTKRLGPHLEVNTMSAEEALELLLARSSAERTEPNLHEGEVIVERLGFHALAIDQAGAYISSRNLNISLYLEHYNARTKKVQREVPDMWDYIKAPKDSLEAKINFSVFTTWELSFDQISGDRSTRAAKQRILTLLAFFDNNQILQSFFERYAKRPNNWIVLPDGNDIWDMYKFQDTLREFRTLSLLQSFEIRSHGAVCSLHPLIQDWIKFRIDTKIQRECTIEAVFVLDDFSKPYRQKRFSNFTFEMKQLTFSHVAAVSLNTRQFLTSEEFQTNLDLLSGASTFSSFLEAYGKYEAAENLIRRVVNGRTKLLGERDPKTLHAMNIFTWLLINLGKLDECEPVIRKAVHISSEVLGEKHPETLNSMNILGILLGKQEKHEEAGEICQKILFFNQTMYGDEDPSTLTYMHNLAATMEAQGKYDDAESLYRKTLYLEDKVLGKEHRNILSSMSRLARVVEKQGNYKEAEVLYREIIPLHKKVLGREHPDTLMSMHDLALLLVGQKRYDEAEPLFLEVIALEEKVLGKEHRSTLTSMHELATLLVKQERYDEAEPLFQEVIALEEKVLGKEHIDTLSTVGWLYNAFTAQGKHDEAEALQQRFPALKDHWKSRREKAAAR
ncbi:Kinesin light chain [Lachnellula occidentalis]|uniref:Kinesin light chain n=1 Tax=Lachnellula occidentalis TaxID=215460 RepID=A0A8H8S142_9HELO|nr:Kinesin light chain [Lachnellula occidentalis]